MKGATVLKVGIAVILVGVAYWFGLSRQQQGQPTARPTAEQPRMSERAKPGFEPARVDLGSRLWGSTVPVDLAFLNPTSDPITIQKIVSSCDCVVVDRDELSGSVVEPGQVLQMGASIDTGEHPGSFIRTVTLTSDTGQEWRVALALEVVGSWTLSPDRLDFGEVRLGMPGVEFVEESLTFDSESDELVG